VIQLVYAVGDAIATRAVVLLIGLLPFWGSVELSKPSTFRVTGAVMRLRTLAKPAGPVARVDARHQSHSGRPISDNPQEQSKAVWHVGYYPGHLGELFEGFNRLPVADALTSGRARGHGGVRCCRMRRRAFCSGGLPFSRSRSSTLLGTCGQGSRLPRLSNCLLLSVTPDRVARGSRERRRIRQAGRLNIAPVEPEGPWIVGRERLAFQFVESRRTSCCSNSDAVRAMLSAEKNCAPVAPHPRLARHSIA